MMDMPTMKTFSASRIRRLSHQLMLRFAKNNEGMAAIEFVFIVPLMLMIIFGTIQMSSAVAVDRKVTLTARTLSDLISQASSITDADITNAMNLGKAILTPYSTTPLQAKISQVYIDPTTLVAKVKWSKSSNAVAHTCNEVVTVPTALKVAGTYLIWSEVTYNYTPVVGYSASNSYLSAQFPLNDQTYTRPRQSTSVAYPSEPTCT